MPAGKPFEPRGVHSWAQLTEEPGSGPGLIIPMDFDADQFIEQLDLARKALRVSWVPVKDGRNHER